MAPPPWLWAVFTIIAAAAQTVRNAAQRELTAKLGTVGATHVRFLFGFPFSLLILACVMAASGRGLSVPPPRFWPWVIDGALAQIFATALMLAAMGERSFVVAIAYIKTEPVQVALFGFVFLGDRVSLPVVVAILIATAGVVVMSLRPRAAAGGEQPIAQSTWRPTLIGLAAGAMFALSAIGYRGAILALGDPSFVLAATATVTLGLLMQTVLLSLYLAWRDPAVLRAIFRAWRPSLFAGFMGAVASEFWFLAFAIATAASVRTLALIEVLFAQAISSFVFRQRIAPREVAGIVLVVVGVALLVWAY